MTKPAPAWEKMFEALVHYKEQYGHCKVPSNWPENPKLGMWVHRQRSTWNKGRLPDTRRERLDALGFVWDPFDAAWEKMFEALVHYKEQYGHCKVPKRWPENPKLGRWVNSQRTAWNKGRLSDARMERLDALGFVLGKTD